MSVHEKLVKEFSSRKFKVEELRFLTEKFEHEGRLPSRKKELAEILVSDLIGEKRDISQYKRKNNYLHSRYNDRDVTFNIPSAFSGPSDFVFGEYDYNPPLNVGYIGTPPSNASKNIFISAGNLKSPSAIEAVNQLGQYAVNWVNINDPHWNGSAGTSFTQVFNNYQIKAEIVFEKGGYIINVYKSFDILN